MKYHKIWLGNAPPNERKPLKDRDSAFLQVTTIWKEQLHRQFPPINNTCFIRIELDGDRALEVAATFNCDEESLAWSWQIETELPLYWDKQAIDKLVSINWMSGLTRSK